MFRGLRLAPYFAGGLFPPVFFDRITTMRIRIFSDLHLEVSPWIPREVNCDLVIMAGDIHTKGRGVEWAVSEFKRTPVIYVLGNHEYYHGSLGNTLLKMKEQAKGTNVHILDKEELVLDGIQFIGGTMWTDYKLQNDSLLAKLHAQEGMSDFFRIRNTNYGRVKPSDFEYENFMFKAFLRKKLEEKFPGKTVVISHHAPSSQSMDPVYKDPSHKFYQLNPAFCSNAENCMSVGDKKVDVWIHGHLHNFSDYVVEEHGTRVICNPRGYHMTHASEKTGFDPTLVIQV